MNVNRWALMLTTASMLVSCNPHTGSERSTDDARAADEATIDIGGAGRVTSIKDSAPTIHQFMDLRDSSPSRFVVDVRCQDRDGLPKCAAEAAVRAATWVASHHPETSELLVNVDAPSDGIGFQLRGAIPSAPELERLTVPQALERFGWNGGSYEGKDAAARWCMADDRDQVFCRALVSDACNPLSPPDTAKLCEAVL